MDTKVTITATQAGTTILPRPNAQTRASKTADTAQAGTSAKKDEWIPSGQAPDTKGTDDTEALKKKWQSFDMGKFQAEIRDGLLTQFKQGADGKPAAPTVPKMISDIPYAVDEETKAASVPDEWSADKASQRIVDFALSFQDQSKQGGTEFMSMMRDAIKEGFRQAKDMMGEVPGPSAKLFNDTYKMAMDKLDKAIGDSPTNEVAESTRQELESQKSSTAAAAPAWAPPPAVTSSLSITA
jgi:hypothetical protein